MVKNLKLLRNQKRISQSKLGDIIGCSQQSINKYENHNVEPDIETLIKLADYFETSVDYLIGRTSINHMIEKVEPYDLNNAEKELIDNYRLLNFKEKESIRLIIENYLSNHNLI